jgi:hypothetical protein
MDGDGRDDDGGDRPGGVIRPAYLANDRLDPATAAVVTTPSVLIAAGNDFRAATGADRFLKDRFRANFGGKSVVAATKILSL